MELSRALRNLDDMSRSTPLTEAQHAPEWMTTTWFNTPEALDLERLRGRVVVLHAFQMLCPGCVAHGIPQAQRVAETFKGAPLTVVGLHTVFEHHGALGIPARIPRAVPRRRRRSWTRW
jgi:hypothetical protein